MEALAVFSRIDHVGAGADDGYASSFQAQRQFQGRLTAVLNNDAHGFFFVNDFQHVFQGEGFEIQAITGVVVGGHRFRVAIDHDGFITVFAHRQGGVHTTVIKLDALANSIGAAAKHHDFFLVGGRGFALFFVGGVHVGRVRGEFSSTGVYALENRAHIHGVASITNRLLGGFQLFGQATIGKTFLLQGEQLGGSQV